MKIGINCLSINPSYRGGINSYTFGLLHAFKAINNNHRFYIFVNDKNEHVFEEFKDDERFEVVTLPNFSSFWRKLIKRLALYSGSTVIYKFMTDLIYSKYSRQMGQTVDVVYTSTTTLFPFNVPCTNVVSMHDIQQVHYPEFFTKGERLFRRISFDLTAQYTDYVQASSQFIKRDLLEHFSCLKEEQIAVIPEGVDIPLFTPNGDAEAVIKDLALPEKFLFYPAQLWHHKNHITVLKALLKLDKEFGLKLPLVLSGESFSASDNIFNFIRDNNMEYVRYLGKVPFKTLIALYQKAHLVITAVLYESSSLCMLEAAAAGRPLVAARTPPNVEMSQILEMNLFEPTNVEELASLLRSVWTNLELLDRQVEANRVNVQQYSWLNAAKYYISLFERVYDEQSKSRISKC